MLTLLMLTAENTGETEHNDIAVLDSLIRKTAEKDNKAFEKLYIKTNTAVYSFVLSILKNRNDAEDISQDVYLAIYKSAPLYKSENRPMAWIMTIAKNLSYRRLNQNRRKYSNDIGDYIMIDYTDFSSVEDAYMINRCMNILDDTERQIVILHSVSGFKHEEISSLLDIPFSTVRSKYSRALKKLKKEIRSQGGDISE